MRQKKGMYVRISKHLGGHFVGGRSAMPNQKRRVARALARATMQSQVKLSYGCPRCRRWYASARERNECRQSHRKTPVEAG